MKKQLTIILIFFFALQSGICQDSYHVELLQFLASEYGLENGTLVIRDTEGEILEDAGIYGNVSNTITPVNNANYTLLSKIKVNSANTNQWDAGLNIKNGDALQKDDIVLFTFVARRISSESDIFFFAENSTTYEKESYINFQLDPDWNIYYLPVRIANDYNAGQLALGLHFGAIAQEFEFAGFTGINYGDVYDLEEFPSTFGVGGYEGSDPDAPWRAAAAARIENIRKADLDINLIDVNGIPVNDATVKIEMQEHDFGFGSAFVTCRFPGNNCFDQTYVNKIFNLDGEGHGFNVGVTENALKWDGWEEQWLGTPAQTTSAVKYLHDSGVEMRGHTLFWPGYNLMPDDIVQNKDDLNYLRNRIDGRIETMIDHSILGNIVTEWDVVNEITQNRDLEVSFQSDPNFSSGREIYQEIFTKVKEANPATQIYVNDYVVLSGGGSSISIVNRYKQFLDELRDAAVQWEGIGFQAHIGAQPTSILKVESVLNEFNQRYGKRIKITEYDISPNASDDIQAAYMSDFLIMIFSNPGVDAFLMWGFWDGNHWKGNAPMFDINWNLKPSGQAFIDKVFKEWWTEKEGIAEIDGRVSFRAFKGKHKITVTLPNGNTQSQEIDLNEDTDLDILVTSVSIENELPRGYSMYPIPAKDSVILDRDSDSACNVRIYDLSGKLLKTKASNDRTIQIDVSDLPKQIVLFKIADGNGFFSQKVLIQD